jgi:hypothetical protein
VFFFNIVIWVSLHLKDFDINDAMGKMYEIIITAVTSACVGLLVWFIKTQISSIYKNKERENIFNILKEIEVLNLEEVEFKKNVINEYKRVVIKDIKGIDVASEKYEMIVKSKILDKYSNSQIRIASRFFTYKEAGLVVKIPWFENVFAIFSFSLSIILLLLGMALFFIAISAEKKFLQQMGGIGGAILVMVFSFYWIFVFVTPVKIASQ